MILVQNATGVCAGDLDVSRALHQAYAERHGHRLVATQNACSVAGRAPQWAKYDSLLAQLQDGVEVCWLDSDCIKNPREDSDLAGVLPIGADLGMVRRTVEGDKYNCGVIFARGSAKVREFFRALLAAGPMPGSKGGDQARLDAMLSSSGLTMADVHAKYNSYWCVWPGMVAPKVPVIRSFHGCQPRSNAANAMRLYLQEEF